MLYVYRNSVGLSLIFLNWIPQKRHFHRCTSSMPILIKYISEVESLRRISQGLGYDKFTCAKGMFLNFTYISWLVLKVKKRSLRFDFLRLEKKKWLQLSHCVVMLESLISTTLSSQSGYLVYFEKANPSCCFSGNGRTHL